MLVAHQYTAPPADQERDFRSALLALGSGFIRAQKIPRNALELRAIFGEDRRVARTRHDPETRVRNTSPKLEGNIERIERVAFADHEQRPRPNFAQLAWSEAHVVVVCGEREWLREERADLRVAAEVSCAHGCPLG